MKTLVNKFHGALNKVAAFALAISMMVGSLATTPINAYAKSNEFYSDNYTMGQGFIDISPRHLYYDNKGNLIGEFYVYNGLGYTIYEISNLKLTVSNDNGVIASRSNMIASTTLYSGYYTTITVKFSGSQVKKAGADLTGWIYTNNTCNYRY